MRQISLAITTWNRFELLVQCFHDVIDNPNISEIVISDDHSDLKYFDRVFESFIHEPKVKLHRNETNLGCYFNKHRAIELCSNEYVIIFDSDNIIGTDYIDKIYETEWFDDVILAPSFAKKEFDYRKFAGLTITKHNVASYADKPMFLTMLNTFNLFINREQYLSVFDSSVEPVTSDSIYFTYRWLNAGNKIHVVDGLVYFHRIHSNSHYQLNQHIAPEFYKQTVEKIKALR